MQEDAQLSHFRKLFGFSNERLRYGKIRPPTPAPSPALVSANCVTSGEVHLERNWSNLFWPHLCFNKLCLSGEEDVRHKKGRQRDVKWREVAFSAESM